MIVKRNYFWYHFRSLQSSTVLIFGTCCYQHYFKYRLRLGTVLCRLRKTKSIIFVSINSYFESVFFSATRRAEILIFNLRNVGLQPILGRIKTSRAVGRLCYCIDPSISNVISSFQLPYKCK